MPKDEEVALVRETQRLIQLHGTEVVRCASQYDGALEEFCLLDASLKQEGGDALLAILRQNGYAIHIVFSG